MLLTRLFLSTVLAVDSSARYQGRLILDFANFPVFMRMVMQKDTLKL